MIPLLAIAGSALPLISQIFAAGESKAPAPARLSEADFNKLLSREIEHRSKDDAVRRNQETLSMIAFQQTGAQLPTEQQIALANRLLNRQVQISDSGGNSSVGVVQGFKVENGAVRLLVNGQQHPLTSVRALLDGVHADAHTVSRAGAQPFQLSTS